MANPSLPRSRSPVLSIRTQPEKENALKAELKAANRTQDEIRSQQELSFREHRYSGPMTDDHSFYLMQTNPTVPINSFCPNLSSTTSRREAQKSLETNSMSGVQFEGLRHLQHIPEPRKSWRQFTKRNKKSDTSRTESVKMRDKNMGTIVGTQTGDDYDTEGVKANTSQDWPLPRSEHDFQWLQERTEERNKVAELYRQPQSSNKRTIRKSVYGSFCSTKSFFRNTSKKPRDCSKENATMALPIPPHLLDFDSKDQLREYIRPAAMVSPLSPTIKSPCLSDNKDLTEPVELSAGTPPVELECNASTPAAHRSSDTIRTSTPSIRDLPPYVDDKKFQADIAKDEHLSLVDTIGRSRKVALNFSQRHTCSNCRRKVQSDEIYDFCTICDSDDRVLCLTCAKQGFYCRHELEHLLPSRTSSRAKSPSQEQHRRISVEGGDIDRCSSRNDEARTFDCDPIFCPDRRSRGLQSPQKAGNPVSGISKHSNICNVHQSSTFKASDSRFDFMKEMSHISQKQDIDRQWQQLELRAQELELKEQRIMLQQREAMVQQKSDMLVRNLEALVSYQELAKGAFIGAQFQSPQGTNILGVDSSGTLPGVGSFASKDTPHVSQSPQNTQHSGERQEIVAQFVAKAEACIQGFEADESRHKSCPASKRKKEGTSGSTNSPTIRDSSPEQSHKLLSRGNSERGASQEEDEDEDGESRRTPKKPKQDVSALHGPQLLFACPYTKNNPNRFSSRNLSEKNYRGCGTHYLPDVSRLKQHLKRVHWQPENYCPRCYEEFENSAKLVEHASAHVACQARECPFPEKMDKTQQERIHIKRPRVHPETVWYDIYKVLFPESPLPDSPYMDGDERIITPLSATPQSEINVQAIQMLSNIFNNRLDQCEELQHNHLRPLIHRALTDSFTEILNSFSLSPMISPVAGPSIVVSPVSRSSSGTAKALDSPATSFTRPGGLEHQRSVTNVVSQPRSVPRLQEPKPPKPKLQVPQDHHRSPSTQNKLESSGSGSPADAIFDIDILPHIKDDRGSYDDDSQSYKKGDDQSAMAVVYQPGPSATRNPSVISLDSGYGSGKSQQRTNPPHSGYGNIQQMNLSTHEHFPSLTGAGPVKRNEPDVTSGTAVHNAHFASSAYQLTNSEEHSHPNMSSYSQYIDQEDFFDIDYPFSDPHYPWSLP